MDFTQGIPVIPVQPIVFVPVNDVVMGGMSSSSFAWDESEACAYFAGNVTTERNGGFASVRSQPNWPGWGSTILGPDAHGVCMQVRGDGRQYKLTIKAASELTGQWGEGVNYQCDFQPPAGTWHEVQLSFTSFAATVRGRLVPEAPVLRGEYVRQVGFMTSKLTDRGTPNPAFVPGRFRLDVRWIRPLARVC